MSSRDTFTAEVPKDILEHSEFQEWTEALDGSLVTKIEAAISKIKNFGVATNVKDLGNGLYEIKWKSGLRVYFAIVVNDGERTLLLLGSGKGKAQKRAISKSRDILQAYDVVTESIKKKD